MPPRAIEWRLTTEGLRTAIFTAAKKMHYSIDRPGMYRRTPADSLDHKIMGDAAAISLAHFISENGGHYQIYDRIRNDDFKSYDPGWDILIGHSLEAVDRHDRILNGDFNNLFTISVKSSRLPQNDTIESAIRNRDFKIFKQNNHDTIADSLEAKAEAQVYYGYEDTLFANLPLNTPAHTQINTAIKNITLCDSKSQCTTDIDTIMNLLEVNHRWANCYLTAYNTRDEIIEFSNNLPDNQKDWNSFGKQMWVAPLRNGKSVMELLEEEY